MLAKLKQLPELSDVASDQQTQGLRARLVFDRDTASRLGITPAAIDQTLYDAYGQRQVSTMFTQLNQYHVVLELKPGFQSSPPNLSDLFIRTAATGGTGGARSAGFGSEYVSAISSTASSTRRTHVPRRFTAAARSTPSGAVDQQFPNGGRCRSALSRMWR